MAIASSEKEWLRSEIWVKRYGIDRRGRERFFGLPVESQVVIRKLGGLKQGDTSVSSRILMARISAMERKKASET